MDYYVLLYLTTALCLPSTFIFALVFFRQPIKINLRNVVISGLLIASVAPIIVLLDIPTASTVGHLSVTLFCFYAIFRYRLLASLVMTLISILISMITEVSYYLIVSSLFDISLAEAAQGVDFKAAISIGVVNYSISALLYKWRLGFSFMWLKHRGARKQALTGEEKKQTLILCMLFIYIGTNTVILHLWEQYFFHSFVTLTILFFVMTIWLYRREWRDG